MLLEESLSKFRAWGFKWGIANALHHIGSQALARADDERAAACLQESMILNRDLGNTLGIAKALVGGGSLALAKGNPDHSARLFAAVEALRKTIGAPMPAYEKMHFDRELARVRALLDEETFATTWNAGKKMTSEQAVIFALEERSG